MNTIEEKITQYLPEKYFRDALTNAAKSRTHGKMIDLGSITAASGWYWESMDLQNDLQALWGVGFMNFMNVEQWLVHPVLDVLRFVMKILLLMKMRFKKSRKRSLRAPGLDLGIPYSTTRNVLPEKLEMFSYKMNFLQQPLPEDYPLILHYAQITRREFKDFECLGRIVFSEDCTFHTMELSTSIIQASAAWRTAVISKWYQYRQKRFCYGVECPR